MKSRSTLSELHVRSLLALGTGRNEIAASLESMNWNKHSALRLIDQICDGEAGVRVGPTPAPDLSGLPSSIQAEDVTVQLLVRIAHPRVMLFGGVATCHECNAIIEAATPKLERSQVILGAGDLVGEKAESYYRTSAQAGFDIGEHEIIDRLARRIAALTTSPRLQ